MMKCFFLQLLLIMLCCSLFAAARAERQALVFNYEAASGQICKISNISRVHYIEPVNLTLSWHSVSGRLPELTLCNLAITHELSASMVLVSDPQRSGCYQLKPVSRRGHLNLKGVILPEVLPEHFINLSETQADWRISFEIEEIPSAIQLQLPLQVLSKEVLSKEVLSRKAWPGKVNETDQMPFDLFTASEPERYRLNNIPGDFRHPPFYPSGGPGPGSLNYIVILPPMLAEDTGETQIQARYLIKIHIPDQDTLYIWLTWQDWQNLLTEDRLTAADIMAFLRQRIREQQLHQDQRQELEDLLDPQRTGETVPEADQYIHYLLEQLGTPVYLDIMPVSHQRLPEILTLGNGSSKSSSRPATTSTSGQASGTDSSSLANQQGRKNLPDKKGKGLDDQKPPSDDTGLLTTSEPVTELDLVAVLRACPGVTILDNNKWLMLLYAFGCLSYEELLKQHRYYMPVLDLLEQYVPKLENLQDKLGFLQAIYTELKSDLAYIDAMEQLLSAVPVVFHKQLKQPITLSIGIPENSEQAVESLVRLLAGALFQFKWCYHLSGVLNCQTALECLQQCRANGIEGFRNLYHCSDFRRLLNTHLPTVFIEWLRGGDSPCLDPALPQIDAPEHIFDMPGISRLNFWEDLALNAYANSAITFHQFQKLVTSSESERFGIMREIAFMLDTRRANRLFSTLQNLLQVQNPRLWEQIQRQSSSPLQAIMGRQLELLPMPPDAGEADAWRRAMAAALVSIKNTSDLVQVEASLFSKYMVEEMNRYSLSIINLVQIKIQLLLVTNPPPPDKGLVDNLLPDCFKGTARKVLLNTMAQICWSDPQFLPTREQEPVHPGTKRSGSQTVKEDEDSEHPCPVCFGSMENVPTGICFNCRNGICLPCAKKIRNEYQGSCPVCRAKALQIPRDFEEKEEQQ